VRGACNAWVSRCVAKDPLGARASQQSGVVAHPFLSLTHKHTHFHTMIHTHIMLVPKYSPDDARNDEVLVDIVSGVARTLSPHCMPPHLLRFCSHGVAIEPACHGGEGGGLMKSGGRAEGGH